jgi:hypothetical protein
MSNFQELIEAARRLAILKALAGAEDYTLPEAEARDKLRVLGSPVFPSADMMAVATVWLDDAGLIVRRKVGATALLILTTRGLDVVDGATVVPGVESARPGR